MLDSVDRTTLAMPTSRAYASEASMSRLAIPAPRVLVDGQHPNLGLIWSRDLGERGARQGDRDGTHDRTPLFGNQQGGVLDSRPRIQQLYVVALIGPPSRAVYPLGQRADYAGLVEPPGLISGAATTCAVCQGYRDWPLARGLASGH
jgi:hypothetical protein